MLERAPPDRDRGDDHSEHQPDFVDDRIAQQFAAEP